MQRTLLPLLVAGGLSLAACAPAAVPVPPGGSQQPAASPSTAAAKPERWTIVPGESEARYKAKEQFANLTFGEPVGRTQDVSGELVRNSDGAPDTSRSKITIDLRNLKTGGNRRDQDVQTTYLETDQFPTATFIPTAINGLPMPTPSTGESSFEMTGDFTLHGVSKPVTWQLTGRFDGPQGTISGTTGVFFADYDIKTPQTANVLKVDEPLTLEIELKVNKES